MSIKSLFENIADAIKDKNPNVTNVTPDEMPNAIRSIPSGSSSASGVTYDNTTSGLSATNVQDAIDEVIEDVTTINSDLTEINSKISGLSKIESLDISGRTTDSNGHIIIVAPSAGEKPLNGWATTPNGWATVETFKDSSNNWFGILRPVASNQSMSSVTITSGEVFWFK